MISYLAGTLGFFSPYSFIGGLLAFLATDLFFDLKKATSINEKIEFENQALDVNSPDINEAIKARDFVKKIYTSELKYVKTSQKIKALMVFNWITIASFDCLAGLLIPAPKRHEDMTRLEKIQDDIGNEVLDGYEALRNLNNTIILGNLGIFFTSAYTLAPWQFGYNRYVLIQNQVKLAKDYDAGVTKSVG